MSISHTTSVKRKHKEEPASSGSQSYGTTAENNKAPFTSKSKLETVYSSKIDSQAYRAVAVLAACRSALVRSPAASRAALEKHRAFIDSELVKALKTVGSYDIENSYDTPLHESVRRGDVATTRALIVAGADVNAKNLRMEDGKYVDSNDEIDTDVIENADKDMVVTPTDLALLDNPCFDFIQHHNAVSAILAEVPGHLVLSALAHCATLSASEESVPAPVLFLRAYHLDSSFLWAPSEARKMVFTWARDVFIIQMATISQHFSDLPDDCSGDIFEYLEMLMTRKESMRIVAHCSSPPAHAWVRAVVAVAVAEKAYENIYQCVEEGDVGKMRACLNKGANFDNRIVNGESVLHEACLFGHTGIVRLLLQAGANPNLKADDGDTALMTAAAFGDMGDKVHGHLTIVKLLLDAGADKDAQKEGGDTALFSALEMNYGAIVELLLQAGVNLETVNRNGFTALLYATNKSDYALIERLLEAGAEIEAKDKNGNTALVIASIRGHTGVVLLLLEAGADKDARNNDGSTALMIAAYENRPGVVNALLDAGADKNTVNECGDTALFIASENGHGEVTALLRNRSSVLN